jgi:hypothetical protein
MVAAAFFYAYTLAFGVVNQSNAYPFVVAAQVLGAVSVFIPGGRRLCMVQIQASTCMQQMIDQMTSQLATFRSCNIPPAAMTTGRRTTTRRTAERFICEGAMASYLVEVSTLKKTG